MKCITNMVDETEGLQHYLYEAQTSYPILSTIPASIQALASIITTIAAVIIFSAGKIYGWCSQDPEGANLLIDKGFAWCEKSISLLCLSAGNILTLGMIIPHTEQARKSQAATEEKLSKLEEEAKLAKEKLDVAHNDALAARQEAAEAKQQIEEAKQVAQSLIKKEPIETPDEKV